MNVSKCKNCIFNSDALTEEINDKNQVLTPKKKVWNLTKSASSTSSEGNMAAPLEHPHDSGSFFLLDWGWIFIKVQRKLHIKQSDSQNLNLLRPLRPQTGARRRGPWLPPRATAAWRWHKRYRHVSSAGGEVIWLIRAEIQEERPAMRRYITVVTTATIKLLRHLLFLARERGLFIPRRLNIQPCCCC